MAQEGKMADEQVASWLAVLGFIGQLSPGGRQACSQVRGFGEPSIQGWTSAPGASRQARILTTSKITYTCLMLQPSFAHAGCLCMVWSGASLITVGKQRDGQPYLRNSVGWQNSLHCLQAASILL
jgi:hypothetical protein